MDILPVDKLAEVLQESNVPLLTQVLRVLGPDRTTAILMDTLQCEANGGMWTKAGTRRRTPGGVFFQRVKQQATRQERRRLFPHPAPQRHRAPAPAQAQDQPQAPTWDEVQALIITFPPGEAAVTLTLTGRPDIQAVQARPTYVAFRMQGKALARCPKGSHPSRARRQLPGWSLLRCASGTGSRAVWPPMRTTSSLLQAIRGGERRDARAVSAELREYGATATEEAGAATATGRDDAMTPLPDNGAHAIQYQFLGGREL